MRCCIHEVNADLAEVNLSFNFRNIEFSLGIYPLTNAAYFVLEILDCLHSSQLCLNKDKAKQEANLFWFQIYCLRYVSKTQ